ncbi:GNAT family N-acetyltransferase [Aeromicrobium sp. Root495]|uniref:GNAT family N-acetyltransferase n=1 Tax=Aeromicrobium sp. Root495 TaxID=1736550 RepID=UPI000B228356|nr:GNAT family N-acetyltransferase [Aeromicrobium sp. Root495]
MTWELRRLTRADLPLLACWLADPDVHRWWFHAFTPEAVERDFGPGVDGLEPGEDLLVLQDGRPFGLVQRAVVTDYPEDLAAFERILGPVHPAAVTLDYLVGSAEDRGRGLGPQMLDAVTRLTFTERPDAPYVLVAVVAANRRSWRALEKAGFRIVGSGDAEPDNPVDLPLHHVLRRDRLPGE